MKKVILCFFTCLILNDFGQAQSKATPAIVQNINGDQTELVELKEQKMIGWILIGAGFAISAAIFNMKTGGKKNHKRLAKKIIGK